MFIQVPQKTWPMILMWVSMLVPAAVGAEAKLAVVPAEPERLRIGLVLGGGGARGAAHVGVLRELERMRVPIDAIAGTSMGAIIGGLYASGMSSDELERLIGSLDWAEALSDTSRREDLSFRRKQDDEQFPINVELGVRDGELILPRGVIQGQKLGLLLRELTLHASGVNDFDALPIPFRAVASDIERGEPYVMRDGDLAQAIRASMSVPGVLAPVRVDGRLLVDGGLVGNLPIDVVQSMGVDVVIAVDVEFPLYPAERLESALTISEQMLTILVRKETLRQIERLGAEDILLRPELGVFGSANFAEITQAIEPGAQAVSEASDRLHRYALEEHSYLADRESKRARARKDAPLAFVRIVDDSVLAPEVLASRLNVAVGDAADPDDLAADAGRLYGLQMFEKVGYRLLDERGSTGVEFDARAKSWGPNLLQFGLSLEDDFEGSTAFNLSTRLTRVGLNPLGAEWRTDLQIGTDPLLSTEFYQPLRADSSLFVAPRFEVRQSNLNTFDTDDTVARFRITEAEAGIDIGTELGRVGEFRTGIYRGGGEARVKVGDPGLPNTDFDTGGAFARLRFDTLDNARFPRKGVRADVTWNLSRPAFGADSSFDTVEADLSSTWSFGRSSVQLGLGYATTIESDNTVQDFFPLGGFLRLSGIERGSISGPHAALARLVYYRRMDGISDGLFDTPIFVGSSVEGGNVWQSRSEIDLDSMRINGSVFVGMDTFFGGLYLAAGFAEGGRTNFYLFLGTPPR